MFLIQPKKVILPGICMLGGSSSVQYILFYFNFLIRTGEEIMLLEQKKRIPGLSSPGRVSLPWGQAAAPRGQAAAGMRAEGAPRIPGPTRPPAPEGAPRGQRLTAASPISPSLRPSIPPSLHSSVPPSLCPSAPRSAPAEAAPRRWWRGTGSTCPRWSRFFG